MTRALYLWALLTVLWTSGSAWAGSGHLSISEDGEQNVNVTIDSALIPNAQIKRKDNQMVIQIPDGAGGFDASKLQMTPGLQGKVDVEQLPGKKTVVTIRSENIYLNIQDRQADHSPTPATKPAETGRKPLPKSNTPDKAAQPKPAQSAEPAQLAANAKAAEAKTADTPSSGNVTPKPADHPKATASTAPAPAVLAAQTVEETAPEAPNPKDAIRDPFAPPAGLNTQGAIPSLANTQPPKPRFTEEGKDGIPLNMLVQSDATQLANDDTLIRVLASLVLVLILIVAFARFGLPKLMERYPGLFKNQNAWRAVLGQVTNVQAAKRPPRAKPAQKGFFAKLLNQKRADALKSRLNLPALASDSETFILQDSLPLGPGQTLHLVNVGERQLVLAATGQQVTLLTEFAPGDPTETDALASAAESLLEPDNEEPMESMEPEAETRAFIAPSSTDAALPEEAEAELTAKEKIAQTLKAQWSQMRDPLMATPPASRLNGHIGPPLAATAPTMPQEIIDAEEVVVLQDYDDQYLPS
jgi:flagellar biogenesis protein FliO